MSGDSNGSTILMNSSDVCTLLDIKESTLRKYAGILKGAGYNFHVNTKGQRGYFEKDVIVIKRFLEIKENRDMTLEQAATAVLSWVAQSDMSLSDTKENNVIKRYDEDTTELKELVNKQTELIKDLIQRMDQQQRYFDQRLEDRDKKLMESFRSNLETQHQLLAIAAVGKEEEKQKGFWNRIFGR